ncbi:MAG: hypothetical protein U0522_03160 [Candidatus Paceibacterota bacterium]
MSEALDRLLDEREHLIASLHPSVDTLSCAFKKLLQALLLGKKRFTFPCKLLRANFTARSHVGQAI